MQDQIKTGRRPKTPKPSRDTLLQAWIASQRYNAHLKRDIGSIERTSRILRSSNSTVAEWLREEGIYDGFPRFPKLTALEKKEIVRLYLKEELRIGSIAKRFRRSHQTIERILDDAGVETRDPEAERRRSPGRRGGEKMERPDAGRLRMLYLHKLVSMRQLEIEMGFSAEFLQKEMDRLGIVRTEEQEEKAQRILNSKRMETRKANQLARQ